MTSPTATPTPGVINGHTRDSPYVYTPSAGANIAFLVIFAYVTHKIVLILGYSRYHISVWDSNIAHGSLVPSSSAVE